MLSLFCLRKRVCLRCCLSLLPIRFCFYEEGEGCRIFRVGNITMCCYTSENCTRRVYCKKGSGKRCSTLKSFVVLDPAHLNMFLVFYSIYDQSCKKRITKLRSARENFFGSPFSAEQHQRNDAQANQAFSWKQWGEIWGLSRQPRRSGSCG